ncbi:hypothetical protein [Ilumatobacter sp.]|uniref:hypothetical protein n=1 Tax=Ilumatobacter sp. TaxID=1967498 RepID=UPI003C5C19AC
MSGTTWTSGEATATLGAMRSVAATGGELGPVERSLIEGAAAHVFEVGVEVDALSKVSPVELAEAVTDAEKRATVTQFLVLVPYADMKVETPEVDAVDAFAAALGVSPGSLKDLHNTRKHHIKRLILDYGRRSFEAFSENSPYGPVRLAARSARQTTVGDKHLAERFVALGEYAEDTLGRTFFDFYRARGFALPGEPKSLGGELLVTHDSSHILGGFNTDGTGEINVAGFEAGMSRSGFGYELLMEVLLDFHVGINVGGQAAGIESKTGEMNPDTMMVGIARGLDCNVDLIGDWDFWSVADQSVLELRERYNIVGAGPVVQPVPGFQQQP